MSLICISVSFGTIVSANWLCRQSASQANGDIFYACGHALSGSLIQSREAALEAAKREFHSFCSESHNCQEFAYVIRPMRTDCFKNGADFECYRGLEYQILSEKRKDIKIDRKKISEQIHKKEEEIKEVKSNLTLIKKLDDERIAVDELEKLDRAEVNIEYLKSRISKDYSNYKRNGISLKLTGARTALKKNDNENSDTIILGGLGVEYDTPLWKNISSRISLSYLLGREATNLKDRGSANTQSETEFHSHKGFDVSAALPVAFGQFTFSPTLGYLALSYKSTQYNYNNFGIGLDKIEKSYHYNSGYVGMGVRYGRKLFVEIEPRQYFKDSKSGISGSLGVRFEF